MKRKRTDKKRYKGKEKKNMRCGGEERGRRKVQRRKCRIGNNWLDSLEWKQYFFIV